MVLRRSNPVRACMQLTVTYPFHHARYNIDLYAYSARAVCTDTWGISLHMHDFRFENIQKKKKDRHGARFPSIYCSPSLGGRITHSQFAMGKPHKYLKWELAGWSCRLIMTMMTMI